MKKLIIFCIFVSALCLMVSTVIAQPTLNFDFNNDGVYETSWQICGKESVEIYLDDWDISPWSSEPIFGAQIYFYYDDTKIKVNEENSFAYDIDHGGVFDPSFSAFSNLGGGKIKLIVADENCQAITDKILLWTLELESIGTGTTSDITIQVDYNGDPAGAISPGGVDCGEPHAEDAGDGSAIINVPDECISEPIPTLTEWGMIIFMTIMMGTGVMILRKRRMV